MTAPTDFPSGGFGIANPAVPSASSVSSASPAVTFGGTLISPASGATAAQIAQAREAAINELLQEQGQLKRSVPIGYGSNRRNRFYAGLEGLNMSDGKVTLYSVHKSGSKLGGLAQDEPGLGDTSLTIAAIQGFLQGSGASNLKAGSFVGMLPVTLQNTIKGVSGEVMPLAARVKSGVQSAEARVKAARSASIQPGVIGRSREALAADIKSGAGGLNMGEAVLIGGVGIAIFWFLMRRK